MAAWEREWQDLLRVARSRGAACAPLSPGDRLSLHPKLEQTPLLDALFELGYPEAPLSIDGLEFFPSYEQLMTWRDTEPGWPRHWLPLNNDGHHWVYYLDAKRSGPVFSIWTDSDFDTQGRYVNLSKKPAYHCLGAFLRAVRIGLEHIVADAITRPPGIVRRILCGDASRRVLDPQTLRRVQDEYGDEASGSAVVIPWLRS